MVLLPAAPHCPQPNAPRASGRAGQRGFTLIELIAVIIILGILAAIIAPRFAGIQDEALLAAARNAASEGYTRLKGANQLYMMDNVIPAQELSELAPARYLNLGAGNALNIGGYVVLYIHARGEENVTIRVYSTDESTLLFTLTEAWP